MKQDAVKTTTAQVRNQRFMLPKSLITVTRLSKIIALTLFIFLPFIGFALGYKYHTLVDVGVYEEFPKSSNLEVQKDGVQKSANQYSELLDSACNFSFSLPVDYTVSRTNNSFFGLTLTDGRGKVCLGIYDPSYEPKRQGFEGGMMQVNAYVASETSIGEIVHTESYLRSGIDFDRKIIVTSSDSETQTKQVIYENNQKYIRYKRSGYGGEDNVVLFEGKGVIYQLVWRGDKMVNIIDEVIGQIKE